MEGITKNIWNELQKKLYEERKKDDIEGNNKKHGMKGIFKKRMGNYNKQLLRELQKF